MSNKIQEFLNDNFGSVRVFTKEEELWFVAKDVCDILGTKTRDLPKILKNKGICKFVIESEVDSINTTSKARNTQDMTCINEHSLYRIIFKSRKPFAEELQDWFCDEVIPSIRRTGGYVETDREEEFVNNTFNVDDEIKDKLIEQLKEKNQELEYRNSKLEPLANNWEKFCETDATYTFMEVCEIISTRAKEEDVEINICVNKLTALLRDKEVLSKRKAGKCYYNLPRAKYRELFNVVPLDYSRSDVSTQTRVKGRGIELIYEIVGSNLEEVRI